ncbi:hypothetical protein DESC_60012 [Desulfosarcina cetonica]|nr:hypothetical protein DESC_60012 [Desulfosarcina cetonica]
MPSSAKDVFIGKKLINARSEKHPVFISHRLFYFQVQRSLAMQRSVELCQLVTHAINYPHQPPAMRW